MPVPGFVRNNALRALRMMRGAARRFSDPRTVVPDQVAVSADALAIARSIRGESRPPCIMIHGVLQRSGTRYIGQVLKLHPDVCAYPRGMVELPFLYEAEAIRTMQARFLGAFPPNRQAMASDDFLPLFGAAFIAYVYGAVPAGQTAMLAMPDVAGLAHFPYLFPFERPMLLMRDGRDLVESMVRSFAPFPFDEACIRWNRNARVMLEQQKLHAKDGWQIFRYEDAVKKPRQFIEQVCKYCDLDPARYPYDRISEIPVIGSSELKQEGHVTWDPLPKPSGFNPVGRWQSWTAKQTRLFKRIAGRTLLEAGYVTNLDW